MLELPDDAVRRMFGARRQGMPYQDEFWAEVKPPDWADVVSRLLGTVSATSAFILTVLLVDRLWASHRSVAAHWFAGTVTGFLLAISVPLLCARGRQAGRGVAGAWRGAGG